MGAREITLGRQEKLDALRWLERFYIENWRHHRCDEFKYRVVYPTGAVRWINDREVAKNFLRITGEPPARKKKRQRKQTKKAKREKKQAAKKANYRAYLQSDEWQEVRNLVLKRDHATCLLCGSTLFLHVHHRHYGTFQKETGEELATLCGRCHRRLHREGWKAAKMGDLALKAVR